MIRVRWISMPRFWLCKNRNCLLKTSTAVVKPIAHVNWKTMSTFRNENPCGLSVILPFITKAGLKVEIVHAGYQPATIIPVKRSKRIKNKYLVTRKTHKKPPKTRKNLKNVTFQTSPKSLFSLSIAKSGTFSCFERSKSLIFGSFEVWKPQFSSFWSLRTSVFGLLELFWRSDKVPHRL